VEVRSFVSSKRNRVVQNLETNFESLFVIIVLGIPYPVSNRKRRVISAYSAAVYIIWPGMSKIFLEYLSVIVKRAS